VGGGRGEGYELFFCLLLIFCLGVWWWVGWGGVGGGGGGGGCCSWAVGELIIVFLYSLVLGFEG